MVDFPTLGSPTIPHRSTDCLHVSGQILLQSRPAKRKRKAGDRFCILFTPVVMKIVLDVGQCRPDHASIARLVTSAGAQIERVTLPSIALQKLKEKHYDLVLVNRKIDEDYSDGLELVKAMQADPQLKHIPVMLISNYPEAQEEAVRHGAIRGFGKNEINDPATRERLRRVLGLNPTSA
jgi:two-component system chemotaxis response regulator CheY